MNGHQEVAIDQLMEELVSYSSQHVHEGGIPFAAFVVNKQGKVLGKGVNRVLQHNDPTAHAEVEAIRDACRNNNVHHLRGATLLASGEPCAMCYFNALYAGIGEVRFAADCNEAAAFGFDYRETYKMLSNFPDGWPMLIKKHSTKDALEPFKLLQNKRIF